MEEQVQQAPQEGGDPQAAMEEAMGGIQQQIEAITAFAGSLEQAGQGEAAQKFAQGAQMLQDGLASLGATPKGAQPAQAGMADTMTGGREATPA